MVWWYLMRVFRIFSLPLMQEWKCLPQVCGVGVFWFIIRAGNGWCSVFCGGCIRYFFVWCGCLQFAFGLIWKMGFQCASDLIWKKTLITRLFPNTDETNPHQSLLRMVDIGFDPKLHNTSLSNATALRNQRRSDCREARSDSKVEHDRKACD